jgi:hypothetical protein
MHRQPISKERMVSRACCFMIEEGICKSSSHLHHQSSLPDKVKQQFKTLTDCQFNCLKKTPNVLYAASGRQK